MNKVVRLALSYFFAVICTFILASTSHTQLVLNELVDIGVMVNMPIRIQMTLKDLIGLAPGYGSILALGMLLGLVIMSSIRNKFKLEGRRITYWVYPIGGFLSVLCVHLLMKPIFDITLIAGARSFIGLLLQCLSGGVGGVVYAASIKTLRRYRLSGSKKRRHSRKAVTTPRHQ